MDHFAAYPKSIILGEGREFTIRLLEASDEAQLGAFMRGLPPEERTFFRDDVTDPEVIRQWVGNIDLTHVIPLVALEGERIVADWTMHIREHGWTRHLANIRGIVHPEQRRLGLGTQMIWELLSIAQKLDIERVVVELVSPQQRLLSHFLTVGFHVEAVLKDWTKDFSGLYQDMLILSMKLEPAWKRMEALILDYGTHGG